MQTRLHDRLNKASCLHPKTVDLGLERCLRLLDALGNPHQHIPPVLHVAGTNGKGSTIAFAKQILEDNGYAVHGYTSPHLVRFNERISLANWQNTYHTNEAYDHLLADTLDEVLRINNNAPITPFEIITCLAFTLFARYPADYVLLEVGLGGRLDATNVIDHPIVTAITSISVDHTIELGDTIEKIAFEKAGIIKPGVPIILPPAGQDDVMPGAARDVIINVANARHAPVITAASLNCVELGLLGVHQYTNAAIAVAMINTANIPLTESIDFPLKRTRWQGRLQRIMVNKCPLWVDGAHNEAGAKTLKETLIQIVDSSDPSKDSSKIWTFFLHIKARKDAAAIMKHFSSIASVFYIPDFPIDGGEATPLAEMITIGQTLGVKTYPLTSIDMMHDIMAKTDGPFMATGSLFWVGEVLKQLSCAP